MALDREVGVAAAGPCPAEADWRLLYEQALERAETAEARVEELGWAERAARSESGSWKSRFEAARRNRQEAVEETKRVRCVAKDALFLESEVARLTRLLREAGVDPRRRSTIMSLRMEVERLRKAVPRADVQARRIRALNKALWKERVDNGSLRRLLHDTVRLYDGTRMLRDQQERLRLLSEECRQLRRELKTTDKLKDRLKARLLRAAEKARSLSPVVQDAGLRKALRLSRPHATPRGRGPGRGARPAGRSAYPHRICGNPYVANGAGESSLLEIEVRAHRRVIRRPRWRRTCGCASSSTEVSAPPAPRLFPNTAYGTSVWSRFLFEHYACLRPLHRVAAWLGDQGLPVAAGTLANSVPRFVPLFEPLAEAIRVHQNDAALRHADETGWRIQALRGEGRSGRAWLWASVNEDSAYFHIDASRSAEAAQQLSVRWRPAR